MVKNLSIVENIVAVQLTAVHINIAEKILTTD